MEKSTPNHIQNIQEVIVRHRKKIIVTLLALLLIAGIVRLFTSFNIIYISLESLPKDIDRQTVSITGGNGRSYVNIGKEGLKVLSTDIEMLSIKAGETIAQQIPVKMPWYRFTTISANLQYSNRAIATSFLSTTGSSCAAYNPDIDQLTGYPCLNASRLLSQEKLGETWQTVPTDTFSYIAGAGTPYKNGVIGALYTEQHRSSVGVKAVGSDGIIYKLPDEITYEDLRANPIVTDSAHPDNNSFVIITQPGDVYIATPGQPEETVSYRKYTAPKEYDPKTQQTRCTLSGQVAHCYRGVRLQGDQALSDVAKVTSTISRLSATTQKEVARTVDESMADTIYATTDGTIYLQKYTDLFRANEKGDVYQLQKVAQQVQSVSTGEELKYISNQGVYRINSESGRANQIFYSSNVKPIRIHSAGDKTFVFATSGESRQTVYGYEVLKEEYNEKSKRLIDLFPARADRLPGVTDQRLIGNELYVSFAAPITKTVTPTQQSLDTVEQRRKAISNAIKKMREESEETLDIKYSY